MQIKINKITINADPFKEAEVIGLVIK